MKYFLKMKAWELFLMIIMPLAITFILGFTFTRLLIAVIVLFVMIVVFGWLYSIGSWSNTQLPVHLKKSVSLYAIGLATPIIYLILVIILYFPILESSSPRPPPSWMLPLHFLSLAGIFYGIWFSARQYMALQKGYEVDFMIFSSTFLFMWIFPLGIWIIQPSVNEIFDKLENTKS